MQIKIPKNLPQFDSYPALFATCGEYEARFFLAHKGIMEELESFEMPPREDVQGKQGLVTELREKAPGAAPHHEVYGEDLKKKFRAKVDYTIHSLLDEYQFRNIYLFAPKYVANRIVKGLEPSEEEKIKIKFFGQYSKLHPLELMQMFWKKIDLLISASIAPPMSLKVKKIIDRQNFRHPAAQKVKY